VEPALRRWNFRGGGACGAACVWPAEEASVGRTAVLGSQAFSADFPVIRGQPGGHYHVSLLTYGKTRGCNFIYVILVLSGAGHETTGLVEGWRCAVADVIVSLVHDSFGMGEDDAGELGWQDRALCAQTDPEAFFPEKGGSTREAKKVCRSCEVRAECLEYALEHDERFGIWGGLSERERRRLKREAV
jgi:WhiB family redox-sensing transcriptional regulator